MLPPAKKVLLYIGSPGAISRPVRRGHCSRHEHFRGGNGGSPSRKESRNLPLEFVEDKLLISKGRLEGEADIIKKGEIDDDSERGRYIARTDDRVGGAMVGIEVPPSIG